jgi:4-hydroxy-tetrahydrodipicolinate synthase
MIDSQRLCGSMPAMVTPLNEDYSVDTGAIAALIEFFIDNGAHGVVVLGSSGEFQGIAYDQRRRTLTAAVEAAAGRIPVIGGAGLPNLWATIEQIQEAADCGVDASLVTPPYYFPIGQDEIVDWFARLVDASSLPILYYHFPVMTKLVAAPPTVKRLAECGVVGLKDSGGSTAWLHSALAAVAPHPEFKLFIGGDGHLLDALVNGGAGCIGLNQNVVPHISAQLYEAYQAGELATAGELQRQAVEFATQLQASALGQPYAKAVLWKMGLCSPVVAPPMQRLSRAAAEAAFSRVQAHLRVPVVK